MHLFFSRARLLPALILACTLAACGGGSGGGFGGLPGTGNPGDGGTQNPPATTQPVMRCAP
ncbi:MULTISPECIES: hypothetical protein [unclassified Variovorax]|jgi:hypothetical protein|uniref:hypothetical protein n=1 Tax=Variovorax TaxID=34072 RepID=UPI0008F24926|nr:MULTISPECIES: hypothetical protein [unclassified Variovorax]KAF1067479.1 MAG: hypothetical protein GAK39_04121 [Variovorax sp.]SFQ09822.1 hypothetical protein SAMN05443579_12231 [Variovorax sp. PDC80]